VDLPVKSITPPRPACHALQEFFGLTFWGDAGPHTPEPYEKSCTEQIAPAWQELAASTHMGERLLNIRKVLNFPGTIAELFRPHAHPIQQRQPKVGLGRLVIWVNDVPARF
jgi:hypothetical protein